MGIFASGDIFQAKLNELLSYIKGVNIYIDDILVLGKGILSLHIDQIIVIFYRLCTTGIQPMPPSAALG